MTDSLHRTASNWSELSELWDGVINFLMMGECVPFSFDMPAIEKVIDEIREDEDARIVPGTKGDQLILTENAEEFRRVPMKHSICNFKCHTSSCRISTVQDSCSTILRSRLWIPGAMA